MFVTLWNQGMTQVGEATRFLIGRGDKTFEVSHRLDAK
jgi:hypothetical protein